MAREHTHRGPKPARVRHVAGRQEQVLVRDDSG